MEPGAVKIIVGCMFGDEGKGLTTSFLCHQTYRAIVVRFNGGHQAGHTVVYNGKRHIFSSFGSGTLQKVPTYLSKYCTFYPLAFLNEYKVLRALDPSLKPKVYVNPLCQLTTPYDVIYNQQIERKNNHGSVGVGFGTTIQRNEDHYRLFAQDLYYENVFIEKLKSIKDYYAHKINGKIWDKIDIKNFIVVAMWVRNMITLSGDGILTNHFPIFEGAQGILLDQNFGFFPNVTRSNTTIQNAMDILKSWKTPSGFYDAPIEVYYVTRSYQTRHGNGFMTNQADKPKIKNNQNETNRQHDFQGNFRTSALDVELLNYALRCDCNYAAGTSKKLVITCMDQVEIDVQKLLRSLQIQFDEVYISRGDSLDDITLFEKKNDQKK